MTNLTKLQNQINEKIGNHNYFYISNEIEHGLILSRFIKNIKLICLNDNDIIDYLKEDGIEVFCLTRENPEAAKTVRSSFSLLEYLKKNKIYSIQEGDYFQTFKISPQFENLVKEYKGILVNTSASLNSEIEQKVKQTQLFEEANISIPKSLVGPLSFFDYSYLTEHLGENFVIQFNRSHTGLGTIFIKNEKEFTNLINKFPKREVRIMEYIEGKTYTFNACMTRYGIYAGGLSIQITGVPELVSSKGATVGNNFFHDFDKKIIDKLKLELLKLEKMLKDQNYLGHFGVDFIIDIKRNEIFIIEINARQTMSVVFHGNLQILNNHIPLSLIHTAEFLKIKYEIEKRDYNEQNLRNIKAGQLFLRNKQNDIVEIKGEFKTGEYDRELIRNKKLIRSRNLIYQVHLLVQSSTSKPKNQNIILLTQKKGNKIKKGGEIARIQVLENIYEQGKVKKEFIDILLEVEKKLL